MQRFQSDEPMTDINPLCGCQMRVFQELSQMGFDMWQVGISYGRHFEVGIGCREKHGMAVDANTVMKDVRVLRDSFFSSKKMRQGFFVKGSVESRP